MTNQMKPSVKVTQRDFFRLCKWIETEYEASAEFQTLSIDEITERAARELHVKLSPVSVKTALDTTGVRLIKRRASRPVKDTPQHEKLVVVAKAVVELMRKLNEPVSEELLAVAHRHRFPVRANEQGDSDDDS